MSISPSVFAQLQYDALRDLAPVTMVSTIPNVLVVHPDVPAKTIDEFNTAVGELTAKVEQLELGELKRDVLKKAELPEALAAKLNGKTREELEVDPASSKELGITTKASPKPPTNPGGGLTPEEPANTKVDPGAFAEKFFKNTKGYLL